MSEHTDQQPAADTPQGTKIPKDVLVVLGRSLAGKMEKGSVNYTRAATGVMALREQGIDADLMEREVVFNPERWTQPHFLYGIRINSLKGRIFGGSDEDTWADVVKLAREQKGDSADHDYLDIGRPHKVELKNFLTLNQDLPDAQVAIAGRLDRARIQVGDALLKNNVDPATPPPSPSSGGPRF